VINPDNIRTKISEFGQSIALCLIYNIDTDEIVDVICQQDSIKEKHLNEILQLVQEFSLSNLMFSQHEKLLGELGYILGDFDYMQITLFPITHKTVLILALDKRDKITQQSDVLFQKIRQIIAE
jgi:hypothetical protein